MKIIDLLDEIADGITPPLKIKYKGVKYCYNFELQDYEDIITGDVLFIDKFNSTIVLNDKVEIIEEKPENVGNLEKLCYQQLGSYQLDNNDTFGFTRDLNEQISKMGRKINEIIDYLKSKESDK